MKQKLFTLLTLLVLCVTGVWGAVSDPSASDFSGGAKKFTENTLQWTTIAADGMPSWASGWVVTGKSSARTTIKAQTSAKKIYLTPGETSEDDVVYSSGVIPTAATSCLLKGGGDQKTLYFYVTNVTKVEAYMSADGDYSDRGLKLSVVGESKTATTNMAADKLSVMTALEGLDASKKYIIRVEGTNTSKDVYLYAIRFTVGTTIPTTYTTVNTALSNQTFFACNATASPALSGTAQANVAFLDGGNEIFSMKGSFKNGSNNWTIDEASYRWMKCGSSATYVITPVNGINIKSATLYTMANSDSGGNCWVIDADDTETPATASAPTAVSLVKDGSGKYSFTYKAGTTSEVRMIVKVVYDIIENIDVRISSAGYATLYYDKKLTIPAGVTAYSASVSGANALLTPIADVIPANTGVILKGDAGTYKFVVTTADAPVVSGNVLKGTTSAKTVAEVKAALSATKVFTLGQNASSEVGLREYSGTDIRAYCAYAVDLSFDPGANFFSFDEDVTAINKVEAKKVENGVYYNLAGQQVAQPSKGLYIVNGRKVIVK